MISLDPNFRDLLSCLNSAGVRYLVVGGYAVNFHGYHRNTQDIDVWIATDDANAERVAGALRSFGFPASSARAARFRSRGAIFSFGRPPFRVDLLTDPAGLEFDDCYARRVEADVDGLRVPVISLEDLVANKASAGRKKDLADVEKLKTRPQRKGRAPSPSPKKKRRS
jgi:hypothetical protein